MAEVASAYVSLIPSMRGSEAIIAREADRAGSTAGKRFGGNFASSLKGALGGVLVGAGITQLVTGTISAASDLNETLSKSRVIFGENADEIERWGRAANQAAGLSDQAAISAAASFGDMFSQIGFGADKTAKMSEGVVQLAADLGSFNNLGTEDVLERIAGGFRGEYDALQKVIPNISAARVQEEALRRTHKASAKELTAAEKAEATLAIIRKDGARATGDFARTSDQLANSQKILHSRVDDLKSSIGTGLLPITTDIVNKTSDFIEGMQNGTGAGGEFVDVLEDARDVGKGVLNFFESIPGPVKKYGAELAVAAIFLNKVNTGLTAGRLRMTAWLDSLGPAEAKMSRVSRASYALGAGIRNLAGAGGMIALVDGAQKTDSAIGALETTLGGAAAGFAVGGPIGAAVGGLGGGLFALYQNTKKAHEETKVSLPSWKEYAQTLDGVSAATTKATRAMVLQRLEESGLLTATRELGLTDRQAVSAMLGNETQRRRLADALRNQNVLTNEQEAALRKETGAIGASRLEQLKHNIAIADNREELRKARQALRDFMDEPSSKRVGITGVEEVTSRLRSLRKAIRQTWGVGADANTSGPGGIEVLLPHGATGGIVTRPTVALIGESGPEAVVPLNRTPGSSPLPGGGGPLIHVENLMPLNYSQFMQEMQTRTRLASLGGGR